MKRIIALALSLALFLPLCAQTTAQPEPVDSTLYDNPFKIHNDLYAYYQRAYKMRSSDDCLAVADSMYAKAEEMGADKAKCLALSFYLTRASSNYDVDQMAEYAEKLRKIAMESGYTQYYYYANNTEIGLLMTRNRFVEAKEKIDLMFKEAEASGDNYGLAMCYVLSGNFFRLRLNDKRAVEDYLKAAKIVEEKVPDQTPSNSYLKAASSCIREKEYADALKYVNQGLKFYADASTKISLLSAKAQALYYLGNKQEVLDVCSQIDKIREENGKNTKEHLLYYNAYREMAKGNFPQALKEITFIANGQDTHGLASEIYVAMGDYKSALKEMELVNENLINSVNKTMDDDIGFMSDRLYNERLQVENAELELERQKYRSKIILILAIAVALLLTLTFLSIFLNYRRRHKDEMERVDFLVDLGHTLRTPLTLVMGPLPKIMSSPSLDDDNRERLSKVNRQARRMKTLINTFLTVADFQKGTAKQRPQQVSVNDWASEQLDTFKEEAASYNVDLIPDLDQTIGVVEMDPDLCATILSNILTFVLRSDETCKPITVSTRRKGNDLSFSISCEGVDPENYSPESTVTGNNLGLRYSKIMVEQLKGNFYTEKPESGGATFRFDIPVGK